VRGGAVPSLARWRRSLPPLSPSTPVGARADGPGRLAVLGLLCFSCTSGQIGGEVGHADPTTLETLGTCDVSREVGISEDDLSEDAVDAPFDLAALIDELDGFHVASTWAWGETLGERSMIEPPPGSSALEIDIRYVPGSTRLIEREPADLAADAGAAGAPATDSANQCAPLWAFDAEVAVRTENGAIDDTFVVVFVAHSAHLATAAFDLTPGDFSGTFELDADDDGESDLGDTRFALAWADGRLSGQLTAQVESGDETSVGSLEVARFPKDGCSYGYDLPADSTLIARAEAALSELALFDLTWPDGTVTELSLLHDFGPSCLAPSSTPPILAVDLTTAAESADGGIDGIWELTASVGFDTGDQAVFVELMRRDPASFEPGQFAAETGITGIPVGSDLAATFILQLSDTPSDAEPAQGSLSVLESRPASCDMTPEEPTDGGGVAPGCAGDELFEIGTATLRSAR